MAGFVAIGLVGCGAAAGESSDDTSMDSDEVSKGGGGPTGGGPGGSTSSKRVLALGDSIAFGMNPLINPPGNPASYKGYPEAIGAIKGVTLDNASCPGETSGSLLDATKPDNGCRAWKAAYSLHADYETTQIAFAESYIKAHKDTKFVSIDIGANDLLLLQKSCAGDPTCIQAGLPGVLGAYGTNLGTTYARLRAAGFTGKFVALTVYVMNYNDALSVGALTALNNVTSQVTIANSGAVADGFGEFKRLAGASGDSCAAGLLIKNPDGSCDIHPSPTGRDKLAAIVAAAAVP
jgi:hypothetical protein